MFSLKKNLRNIYMIFFADTDLSGGLPYEAFFNGLPRFQHLPFITKEATNGGGACPD
jgi:hypothetical protein